MVGVAVAVIMGRGGEGFEADDRTLRPGVWRVWSFRRILVGWRRLV